ncbi:MAG: alpha-1,2-fucosyltransferase, partial [Oscillospiraceae bacterium]|nr:alpha-1,2-fucosyltransferase [Oscillospiraceae bacterium]
SEVCSKRNKFVLGWFQSEKYFSNIRPILLKEFQFRSLPSDANQKMINEISECNSVCVHIRRGDMLNQHYSFFARCNEKYYQQGMEYISERTENPIFYIFSNNHDDIEWIRNNYHFDFNVKYVDLGNAGHDDMRLMYNCKHFVMSRSTFSWWGSYMSQNEDKIVVAPEIPMEDCWLKDQNNDDFYRSDMIKIHVDLEESK